MAKPRSYRTEGIVLRRSDVGEADRLLTLYTREHGKIRALAKGARKPQSRKTGYVELFMRTLFQMAKGRTFDIITQVELVEPYQALREDLIRVTYAGYVAELLDSLTPEEESNPALYVLLSEALGWFSETDNYLLAARHYELRLLSLTGFQPQLFFCIVSGDPIANVDQFFSAEAGGLIAPDAHTGAQRARPISAAAVKTLRFLQTRPWDVLKELRLRSDLNAEIESIMLYYLQYVLEKRLKSADFLLRLRREASLTNR